MKPVIQWHILFSYGKLTITEVWWRFKLYIERGKFANSMNWEELNQIIKDKSIFTLKLSWLLVFILSLILYIICRSGASSGLPTVVMLWYIILNGWSGWLIYYCHRSLMIWYSILLHQSLIISFYYVRWWLKINLFW